MRGRCTTKINEGVPNDIIKERRSPKSGNGERVAGGGGRDESSSNQSSSSSEHRTNTLFIKC